MLVLLASAAQKFLQRDRMTRAIASLLNVVPAPANLLRLMVAAAEALAGMALFFNSTRTIGAWLALMIWSVYAAGLMAAHIRGQSAFDCGCSFGTRSKPIDAFVIGRAIGLCMLALLIACVDVGGPVAVDAPFAGVGLFSLYFAASELAALPVLARKQTR